MAETEEFALDAPVPPPWVLPGQPLDQFAEIIRDWWASGGVRIGPFVLDQAPVPGEQGARRHDPIGPKTLGQQSRQRGDHGTVGPVRLRAADLTAQDRKLVPQHQDFHIL